MGKPLKKNLWLVIESSRTFLRNQKAWGSSSFFYGPFVLGLWEDTAYKILIREGNGNPLWYSCPENPHGPRSLVGYTPWGRKESDTTE